MWKRLGLGLCVLTLAVIGFEVWGWHCLLMGWIHGTGWLLVLHSVNGFLMLLLAFTVILVALLCWLIAELNISE
jgi:hypothetical protein